MPEYDGLRCPHCCGKLPGYVSRNAELARIREATIRDARVLSLEAETERWKANARHNAGQYDLLREALERTGGFHQAWAAYTCAMYGHVWTWTSYHTGSQPPVGAECSRCHARKAT